MADFARSLSMQPAGLTKYLNGKQQPGNIIQKRLRDLGCDIEWLMTGKTAVEYKQQQENDEILKLKEEVALWKGKYDELQRRLRPLVVGAVHEAAKYGSTIPDGGKSKMPKR